jgi:streptogramin lyase
VRALNRLWTAAGATAIAVALGAGSAAAEPVGQIERLDVGCSPRGLISGPGASIWFTCFDQKATSGGRGKVGLITPTGEVIKFGRGIDPNSEPGSLTVGPDGNVWFAINTGINLLGRERHPAAIGRVTPTGQLTTFRAGLGARATVGSLVAGPDGNVWFAEGGPAPALGRITPSGEIAEFRAGLRPKSAPGGIAVGADGNLWFADHAAAIGRITPAGTITEFGVEQSPISGSDTPVAAPDGSLWLNGGTEKPLIVRVDPAGAVSEFSTGLNPAATSLSQLAAGPDGNFWFTARGQIRGAIPVLAIGRITASGEIAEFSDCLHEGPPYTGPETIVAGPDGNLWFTSVTTRSLPNIGTPPAIGRITPSGQITEFRGGLGSEPKLIVAGPDGRVWFAGTSGESIERITPPTGPVNTFLVEGTRRASRGGLAKLGVTVPGPGVLELEQRALLLPHRRQRPLPHLTTATAVPACGAAVLDVKAKGAARARFRATDAARLKVRLTFTPAAGTPYSQMARVGVYR